MWEALSSTFFNVWGDGGDDAYGLGGGAVRAACERHVEIEHNGPDNDLTFVVAHLK